MGLLKPQVEYLVKTCKQNNIRGSILTLGKMDIFISIEELKEILIKNEFAKEINGVISLINEEDNVAFYNLINTNKHIIPGPTMLTRGNCITDTLLYRSIGFSKIDSIDIQNESSIKYDLNKTGITSVVPNKYDLVLDGGVMEHVFDIRSVFLNSTDLLKEDGFIVHIMPANNSLEHGFYQFSPTLFNDYYAANKYTIINNFLLEMIVNKYTRHNKFVDRYDLHRFIEYDPNFFGKNSFGQLSDSVYFVTMCARKNKDSLRDTIPMRYAWTGKQVLMPW